MENGKIKEAGTHKALMKAKGRYAHLINNYQLEQSSVMAHSFFYCLFLPTNRMILTFCYYVLKEKKEDAQTSASDSSEHSYQGRERSKSSGIENAGQRSYSAGYFGLVRLVQGVY